jgi:hypothetical protein
MRCFITIFHLISLLRRQLPLEAKRNPRRGPGEALKTNGYHLFGVNKENNMKEYPQLCN